MEPGVLVTSNDLPWWVYPLITKDIGLTLVFFLPVTHNLSVLGVYKFEVGSNLEFSIFFVSEFKTG